jgi:hypothetical protein
MKWKEARKDNEWVVEASFGTHGKSLFLKKEIKPLCKKKGLFKDQKLEWISSLFCSLKWDPGKQELIDWQKLRMQDDKC